MTPTKKTVKKTRSRVWLQIFENFDELLNQVEMLDIVTPTIYHYDYAMKAIEKVFIFFHRKTCN